MKLRSFLGNREKPPVSSSWLRVRTKNGLVGKFLHQLRKNLVEPLASSVHPPWFDARGIGIGLFVGFGIPVGAQIIFLGLLRLVFRFNSVMAFAFTWVNNPITLLPMYYGFYCLGSVVLGHSPVMSVEEFRNLLRPILHAGYFWDSMCSFLYLGGDLLVRWCVGALVVGATAGMVGYVVGYRARKKRCGRKARQMGITYENLVRRLESKAKRT